MEDRERIHAAHRVPLINLQHVCAPPGSGGVSVRAGGSPRYHVLFYAASGTDDMLQQLFDEVLLFIKILTKCLFCMAACRRPTVLLTQDCWKKQKRCSAAFSPGLNLLAVCVETSSPHYSWSKKPQVSVCVFVYVVLFLAIGRPLVARLKHAVIF